MRFYACLSFKAREVAFEASFELLLAGGYLSPSVEGSDRRDANRAPLTVPSGGKDVTGETEGSGISLKAAPQQQNKTKGQQQEEEKEEDDESDTTATAIRHPSGQL